MPPCPKLTDVITVSLEEGDRGGYGLVLRPPTTVNLDPDMAVPVLASIDDNSPASR